MIKETAKRFITVKSTLEEEIRLCLEDDCLYDVDFEIRVFETLNGRVGFRLTKSELYSVFETGVLDEIAECTMSKYVFDDFTNECSNYFFELR